MPEIDDELVARAVRWCAEAGQITTPEEVRAALAPLSWDQLLAVRACLADPPPARSLGPVALADLGRGAAPCGAGQRKPHVEPAPGSVPGPARADEPSRRRRRSPREPRPVGPIIHRASERSAPDRPPARERPPLDELSRSEGRPSLERLIREHGARRGPLIEAIGRRWCRADGSAPRDEDLTRLLDEHGLSRAFARRERDEILHALRAAGGDRVRAATAVGLATPDALDAAVARLGATAQAESIREAARMEIRRRATLTDRARLLLCEEEHLRDLGLLGTIESDLASRLPEHLRALRASGADPLILALGRSLSLRPDDAVALLRRLGLAPEAAGDGGARDRRETPPAQRAARGPDRSRPRPKGVNLRGRRSSRSK